MEKLPLMASIMGLICMIGSVIAKNNALEVVGYVFIVLCYVAMITNETVKRYEEIKKIEKQLKESNTEVTEKKLYKLEKQFYKSFKANRNPDVAMAWAQAAEEIRATIREI